MYRSSVPPATSLVRKGRGFQRSHTQTTPIHRASLQHALTEANTLQHTSNQFRLTQCLYTHPVNNQPQPTQRTNKHSKAENCLSLNKIKELSASQISKTLNVNNSTNPDSTNHTSKPPSSTDSKAPRKKGRPFGAKTKLKKTTSPIKVLQSLGIHSNKKPLTMATLLQSFQSQWKAFLSTSTQSENVLSKLQLPEQSEPAKSVSKLQSKPVSNSASTLKKVALKRKPKSSKQTSGTRMVQSALGKSPDANVVMVIPECVGVIQRGGVSRKGHTSHTKTVSPTIVDYFKRKQSSPQTGMPVFNISYTVLLIRQLTMCLANFLDGVKILYFWSILPTCTYLTPHPHHTHSASGTPRCTHLLPGYQSGLCRE